MIAVRMALPILALMGLATFSTPASAQAVEKGDVKIAEDFVASVGKEGAFQPSSPIASDVLVEVLLRNPIKGGFVPKYSGRGIAALTEQTGWLFKTLGRPKGESCKADQGFAICQFRYPAPTTAWMAAVTVSGGSISRITYIYVTPSDVDAFRSQK
jgi:hypothetical protein